MERLTKQQKWVCGIVLSLGIISAVLGLVAEVKRIKAYQVRMVDGHCFYPSSPALALGVSAALVLLIAQVLVTVLGGCVCCRSAPPGPPNSPAASNRSVAIICLVACWITFLNAFALLMAGASLNDQRQEYMWLGGECNVVKPLVFAGGSLLALATVVLDLIFYLASSAANSAAGTAQVSPQQIAMGQQAYPSYPAYPVAYGQPMGNPQAYSYPYGPFPHPAQNQMQMPPNPNFPPAQPYPGLVTGYPKSPPRHPY
ncbi:unnamed protein product [Calypogeia fissa]